MQKIHTFFLRITTVPVWLFFMVASAGMTWYMHTKADRGMKDVCGESVQVPDMQIGYTGEHLRDMLSYMGPECRELYYFIATMLDSVYPVVYGLFFLFSIVLLYYKRQENVRKGNLYLFPILAVVFDFAENISIARLLKLSGNYPDLLLNAASLFSLLKWFFVIGSVVLMVLGLINLSLSKAKK